jgi:predicted porin
VELYGILDVAAGHVEKSLNADPNYGNTINGYNATKSTVTNSVNALINGGIQGSRWGIRGNEDLGNGLKAVFVLESGINVQNGTLSNGAAALAAPVAVHSMDNCLGVRRLSACPTKL